MSCRVYDISETDGRLFLSMEYIEGEDLAAAQSDISALGLIMFEIFTGS